jgi:hypothetical protein
MFREIVKIKLVHLLDFSHVNSKRYMCNIIEYSKTYIYDKIYNDKVNLFITTIVRRKI